MQYSYAIHALVSATSIICLPLNIHLGTYSPTSVVGDSKILFRGIESAQDLDEVLSGAFEGTETTTNNLTRVAAEAASPATENELTLGLITPSNTTTPTVSSQDISRDIKARVLEP